MEDTRPAWGKKLSNIVCIPQRAILAVMLLLGLINCYTMRSGLSMAINRIVVKRDTSDAEKTGAICPKEESDEEWEGGDMDWSQDEQGFVMSSFYIGYVITHLPGGMIADKFGGKWVCSLGILMTAVFTFIQPMAIKDYGRHYAIACRICAGLGQGTTFPAVSNLLAKWIPKKEMSFVGSLVMGGSILGTVVSNFASGWMLSKWEWPVIFYVYGISSTIWFIFFTLMCFNNPIEHPYLSDKEKAYLIEELGSLGQKKDLPLTPWIDIFLSGPFMSMLLANIGHDWGFFVMVTDLPKYMNDVLQFSIGSNGLYTALPFLGMYILILILGFCTDKLITKGYQTINSSRKLNTGIGNIGPGVFMVAASYAGCDRDIVVICFIISMTLMAPYYVGLRLSPMDMSPNYAGSLMAVANGVSGTIGAIVPPIIGYMTPDTTLNQWRMVFWLSLAVLSGTFAPYFIFGSAEIQPWNEGSVRKKKAEEAGGKG